MARTVYVPEAGGALNFPDGTTDQQIVSYVRAKYAPKPAPAPPEAGIGALESGFYGALGRAEAAGGKAAQGLGIDWLASDLFERSRASTAYAEKYKPDVASVTDIQGVGDAAKFAGSTIAQSAPETAVGLAGAYAGAATGAAIGSVVPGPGTAVGGVVGGIVGGAIASLPFFIGGNIQAQAREQGIPLEETSGYAASIGAAAQAPLDAAFDTLIARKFPGAGAALDVVKKGFLKEVATTAGKAAVTEALTEPAQQAIEIAQSNPNKLLEFSPDVQNELLNAAAAGALAGGVIGGAAIPVSRVAQGAVAGKEEAAKRQLESDVLIAAQKGEQMKRNAEINSGIESFAAQPSIGKLRAKNVRLEPTPENGLKAPLERVQVVNEDNKTIAEFSSPRNARDAVGEYSRVSGKKVNLEGLEEPVKAMDVKLSPVRIGRRQFKTIEDATVAHEKIKKEISTLERYASNPDAIAAKATEMGTTAQGLTNQINNTLKNKKAQLSSFDKFFSSHETKPAVSQKPAISPEPAEGGPLSPEETPIGAGAGRRIERSAGGGVALQYPDYESFLKETRATGFPDEQVAQITGISNEKDFLSLREYELQDYVEAPAQDAVRRVYAKGGKPFSSNAFGPGRKGVEYEDANGETNFEPLTEEELSLTQRDEAPAVEEVGRVGGAAQAEQPAIALAPEALPTMATEVANEIAPVVSPTEQKAVRSAIKSRVDKISSEVRGALNRYNLKDVETKFVPAFTDAIGRPRAAEGKQAVSGDKSFVTLTTGVYDPKFTTEEMVTKAIDAMNHETIHSVFDLGLLRSTERQVLLNAVSTAKVPGKKYTYLDYAKAIYDPTKPGFEAYADPDVVAEEAVAEMFRDWRKRGAGAPSNTRGLFNRLIESLRSIFNTMRRNRYEDIFSDIETGKVGLRERAPVKETKEKMSIYPENPNLSVAPVYPYGQRVPQVSASDTDRVISELEYGAIVTKLAKLFKSKTLSSVVPERFRPSKEAITDFVRKWADKILPVGQMIDYVKQNGGTVPDALDVYQKAQLSQSITANNLEARERDLYEPLVNGLKESGISLGEFENYLYALHAPERNERLREITPIKRDKEGNEIPFDPSFGSGMSDEKAGEIVNLVQSDPRYASFVKYEEMVRKIIDDTNQLRIDSGLSPDFDLLPMTVEKEDGTIVTLRPFEKYVPLRGFADESAVEGELEEEFRARVGQGFKIKGREDMRAMGRTSEASDILAHIMLQNSEAVVRAEKNKVGLSFLDLIEANPEIMAQYGVKIIEPGKKPMRKVVSSKGIIKSMVDPMYKNRDDVFVVKREGVEVPISINNRMLQKALITNKSADPASNGKFIRALGWLNRSLAAMNTVYNPEFALVNFPRDIQQALLNVSQYEIDGIKTKILKDALPAAKGVFAILRKPETQNNWSRWYKEFREDGGNTSGFYGAFSVDEQVRKIEKIASDQSGSATGRAKIAFNAVKKWMEDYNGTFENAVRLSVYKNLVEAGASRQKAAFIAKNITVNFDQRGEFGPVMNSLYLFYNASVQGTMTLLTAAARSKKVRRALGGLVMFGFIQDQINSMMSDKGEDDEPLYDKLPDYKLENNIILMDPFGLTDKGYIAIPLAYGANSFVNLGRAISRNLRGGYTTSEAATSMVTTFIDAFNPVGGTESFLNFVVPTALDPVVALSMNLDYSGRRIYPEAFPGSIPKANSQTYFSSTSPAAISVAQFLNEWTGGSEYVPGYISIKPDAMEYVYDYILGATGATARRVIDSAMNDVPKLLAGDLENIEINNVPVLRKVYGNVSERMSFEDYFDKVNHVLTRGEELKFAMKEGDPARIKAVRQKYADELKIYPAIKALANRRNKLAAELRKVRENEKMPPEQKRRRQEILQKQIEEITNRVDKLYGKQIGDKYPGLFS